MNKALLAVGVCLVLGGCSEDRLVGRPDLQIRPAAEFPPPTRQDLILEQRSYVIGPFDRVSIEVYGVPELSRTVQVDASGNVSLPLAGDVVAAGKTSRELASTIADRLRARYMRDPQVTVNTDTVNQMVTVDGEVREPGMYPVTGRMTLMRAIARARGTTEYARSNYIIVFRTVDRQNIAALYDLRAIRQGIYQDPEIYANDVVVVSESRARRVFQSLIPVAGLLATPLVAVLN